MSVTGRAPRPPHQRDPLLTIHVISERPPSPSSHSCHRGGTDRPPGLKIREVEIREVEILWTQDR